MIQGKRERLRIVGDYIMTQRDVQIPQEYADGVAYGGWSLDDHPPACMHRSPLKPARHNPLKCPYLLPMRSLSVKDYDNLWMAGRNISGAHVALSSTRVMATCASLCQAVGVAMQHAVAGNM